MLVHRQDVDRVAVLTLNNAPANGYSYAMHRELDAHVCDVRMDVAIDVIVLRGAGDRFFCAGADIGYLQGLEPEEKYYFCLYANETLLRLENTPKLVIAALNGHCVGGGLEIALACDLRIGKESGAKPNLVGLPEVALGVLPGTGGTQRLSRIIGRARAMQLMVEGRNLAVEEAAAMGLVHHVLPADDWWQEVLKYARSFCAPTRAAGAVGLIKRAVVAGSDLPLESGLALERELQQRLFTSPDAKEGLAAFLGKRTAVFSGRPVPGRAVLEADAPTVDLTLAATLPAAAVPLPTPAAAPVQRQRSPAPKSSGEAALPDRATALAPPPPSLPAPGTALAGPEIPVGSVFEGAGNAVSDEDQAPPPPDIDLERTRLDPKVLDLLPTWLVRQYLVVPVRRDGEVLVVALQDPLNTKALAAVREHTGLEIRAIRADQEGLLAAYTMHYRL